MGDFSHDINVLLVETNVRAKQGESEIIAVKQCKRNVKV